MLELLRRPIPELLSALDVDGAAVYALGDAGAAVAPHTGAAVYSQCCQMDRLSNGSACESAWYPGEASGEARAGG